MQTSKIALISLSTLEGAALSMIAEEQFGVQPHSFADFSEYKGEADTYCVNIVDVNTMLKHLDFFLPRKSTTIVITRVDCTSDSENYTFPTIGPSTDMADIFSLLRCALKAANDNPQPGHGLSQRETDVLREIAFGMTNKEIATHLCISVNTVITHRKNISQKLGIRSASGLSLYALMNGII